MGSPGAEVRAIGASEDLRCERLLYGREGLSVQDGEGSVATTAAWLSVGTEVAPAAWLGLVACVEHEDRWGWKGRQRRFGCVLGEQSGSDSAKPGRPAPQLKCHRSEWHQ